MRFVALPVEIDAYPWHGRRKDIPREWWDLGVAHGQPIFTLQADGTLIIQTTEGPARCLVDFHHAARGTEGEFYPIRNSVMRKKYAEVEQ